MMNRDGFSWLPSEDRTIERLYYEECRSLEKIGRVVERKPSAVLRRLERLAFLEKEKLRNFKVINV